MAFEGLICPACSNPLDESKLEENMVCPSCSTKLKQKKFLAFLEFLMMHGLVTNIDFFDQTLYGDEIKKTVEEKEQQDETNPDDYEDKASNIDYIEETPDLKEVTPMRKNLGIGKVLRKIGRSLTAKIIPIPIKKIRGDYGKTEKKTASD